MDGTRVMYLTVVFVTGMFGGIGMLAKPDTKERLRSDKASGYQELTDWERLSLGRSRFFRAIRVPLLIVALVSLVLMLATFV